MENRAGTSTDFPDSTMPTQSQGRISLLVLNNHHHYLMITTNQNATLWMLKFRSAAISHH